ncbi:MAG TPA: BatA domain-containing protein [Phycisphaerae bacterium]|nr:BatA domain-containing protein [Phycisphaerae bacterium]
MPLAALTFAAPLMLIGLLAAGIPVLLHLLNRIRSPIVQFPTLRFLRITAQKTSRRRQLQQFLLLLMRMAVFAVLAMAIAGPLIHGGRPALAYGMFFMFLAGIAIVAIGAVVFANSIDQMKSTPAQSPKDDLSTRSVAAEQKLKQRRPGILLPAFVLLAGLIAAGVALFGLGNDTWFPGSGGQFDGSRVACAIILDNSQSMLVHDGSETRLDASVQLARELLTDTLQPAQSMVLLTNPSASQVQSRLDPNRVAVLGSLDSVTSQGRAVPMRQLIAHAASLLENSDLPNRMLIVISDFAGPASSDADMFQPLEQNPGIQLVLMPQSAANQPDDVGIASFDITAGQAVIGSNVTFKAAVINNGQTAVVPRFGLAIDDQRALGVENQVQLGPAGTGQSRGSLELHYQLPSAGYHLFTLQELQSSQAMPWADQRSLVLNIAKEIPVLVVGNQPALGGDSAAFYVDAALEPFSGGVGAGNQQIWSISTSYRGYTNLADIQPGDYDAIFMCDVPRVSADFADRLENFVKQGGRLCWLLGPSVDPQAYNAILAGNRQLLPGTISGPITTLNGSPVDWVDLQSNVFADLFESQDPFRRIVVVGRWAFSGNSPGIGNTLSRLQDESLFLVQHSLGGENGSSGSIYTFLTAPSGGWTNMADTSAFLPMIVRIAMGDVAALTGATSFEPGQPVNVKIPGANSGENLEVDPPGNQLPINVVPTSDSSGRPIWTFYDAAQSGVYHWHTTDGRFDGMFVVNPPAEEVDLYSTEPAVLSAELPKNQPVWFASTADQLFALLLKSSQGNSLMPGILSLVLIMAVLEALLANRHRPTPDESRQISRPSDRRETTRSAA